LPATLCPSANEIGRIFGLEDVVLSGGKFDDADGIICRYGPAGESPPSLSESGVAMPSESFKASVLQARPDSPSAQSTERLSNSLMAASEPIELGLSGEAEVRARSFGKGMQLGSSPSHQRCSLSYRFRFPRATPSAEIKPRSICAPSPRCWACHADSSSTRGASSDRAPRTSDSAAISEQSDERALPPGPHWCSRRRPERARVASAARSRLGWR
jgi:hypothetical protein